ncbi:MAG TPA: ATPase domain-containing protein [Tepidisphaeraceae bacterium]
MNVSLATLLQPSISPVLGDIKQSFQSKIELTDVGWFSDFLETFAEGGSYLLGGAPGSRKSGLATQIALDLARNQHSVLIIPTEEPAARIAERCTRLMTGWETDVVKTCSANICVEQQIPDIEQLPGYIGRQILSPGGPYHSRNLKMVILDSVQGWGLPASASRRYERLLEGVRLLSSANITTLLVNHVTKRNELAGPRTLEHAVDGVLLLRKTPSARLLFCSKNRFGPADPRNPMVLALDPITLRLNPSPLARAVIATANTYLGGSNHLTEVQAAIALSDIGCWGRVMAPGLPKAEVQQLIDCIAQLPDVEVNDMDFSVHCRLPGRRQYDRSVGLALAMALLGSYQQKPIPASYLFLGEVDLARNVRPVSNSLMNDLINQLNEELEFADINRIFAHPQTTICLQREGIEVVPCLKLEQAVYACWSDLR